MLLRILVAVATLGIIVACSDSGQTQRPSELDETLVASESAPESESIAENGPSESATLPEHEIIHLSKALPHKISMNVRLKEKVTEDQLKALALHLKGQVPERADRTFILYWLPGMAVGSGAWASTHFDPQLEVKILSLTIEEERAATSAVETINNKVGVWLDDRPYVGATVVMFEEGGEVKLKTTYKDGSGSTVTLVETKSAQGRKLANQSGSDYGEYYVLSPSGELSLYDNEGLILKMKKQP